MRRDAKTEDVMEFDEFDGLNVACLDACDGRDERWEGD